MPTGVAIRDVRQQLFAAAERVLLRDGPSGLTSRAVTTEAGCAKGVLHRHFADFDAFLAELVLDRIEQVGRQSAALLASAGTGTVTGNLTGALTDQFGSVPSKYLATTVFSLFGMVSRLISACGPSVVLSLGRMLGSAFRSAKNAANSQN